METAKRPRSARNSGQVYREGREGREEGERLRDGVGRGRENTKVVD